MAAEMSADQKSEPATLEVGAEEVKMEMPETREVDMHDRDPNHMNDHVKVRFQDLIGEPDQEVFSFDRVWELSYKVFTNTKLWCYRITSLLCALPLAICWGIYFACLSFCRIWLCVPCIKACDIKCLCCRKIYDVCMMAFCHPFFEAVGKIFSNIRIFLSKPE